MDSRLLKKIYRGVDNLKVRENCSLTDATCIKCTSGRCPATITYVKRFQRIVGWIGENGRVIKTNPTPGKRYKRKVLGIKREVRTWKSIQKR